MQEIQKLLQWWSMKIGIFTPYLETMSGGERYMLTIAQVLSEKNEVFLFWEPKEEEKYKKIAKEKLDIDIDGVTFKENIFSSKFSPINRIKESRKYNKIIVLSDGSIPTIGAELYLHFQFPVEAVVSSLFTKLKAKSVKQIFCNSEYTKEYIDKKFSVNSCVLYPPVRLLSPKQKENKIINVGRLNKLKDETYFKRQDVLINTFKKMVDKGLKNWNLSMVISTKHADEDIDIEKFQNLAKDYPITIHHNITKKALENEYESAKIYWHAAGFEQNLTLHPEWAEHFGITTVEAMSAGVVPIVFNAGGQKEIINNEKDGFLWNTLDDLKEQTLSLVNNEELRKKMARSAEEKAEEFSEEKFKQKLLQIIQ